MLSALPAYIFLVSNLDDAKFLSASEREYLRERILWDGTNGGMTEVGVAGPDREKKRRKYVLAAFRDVKVRVERAWVCSASDDLNFSLTLSASPRTRPRTRRSGSSPSPSASARSKSSPSPWHCPLC